MIRIENPFLPTSGYTAMTLWPLILIRTDLAHRYTPLVERHEQIHARQQQEMLAVGAVLAAVLAVAGCGWWSLLAVPLFLWWYWVEWSLRALWYGSNAMAYRRLLFEQEAYDRQQDPGYLDSRRPFAWLGYMR